MVKLIFKNKVIMNKKVTIEFNDLESVEIALGIVTYRVHGKTTANGFKTSNIDVYTNTKEDAESIKRHIEALPDFVELLDRLIENPPTDAKAYDMVRNLNNKLNR